jgi:exonuclease SbcC
VIIQEVEIEDFRSHRRTMVTFQEGITVMVGENGSGKTSILEAVNFALFKQKPRDVNMDDLIRRGSEEARVSVTFRVGGRRYRVVRARRKGKPSGSSLYVENNGLESLLVKGEEEITREIEKLAGVEGDLFTSAVYIKQGEIDALLGTTPARRKEQVGRLLGAHDVEAAYQKMRDIVGDYRTRLERYARVPEEMEEKKRSLTETKDEIARLEVGIEETRKLLEAETGRLSGVQETFRLLERLKELRTLKREKAIAHTNARKRIEEIESYERIQEETREGEEEYREIEARLRDLRSGMEAYSRLEERFASLKRERETAQEALASLEAEVGTLYTRYSRILEREIGDPVTLRDALGKERKGIEEESRTLEEKARELAGKINGLKGQNREIQKARRELEEAGERCPVCESPLSQEHRERVLRDYDSRLEANQDRIALLEAESRRLEEERRTLETRKTALEGINPEMLSAKAAEMEKARERLGEVQLQLQKTGEELVEMGDPKSEYSALEEKKDALREAHQAHITALGYLRRNLEKKEGLEEEAEKLLGEISQIDHDIQSIVKTLGYDPGEGEVERVRSELEALRAKVQALEVKKTEKETLRKAAMEMAERLEGEISKLREELKEAGKLRKFIKLLEDIRGLFHKDRLQRELRVSALPIIERYTRELFDSFNLPYTDLKLTEDFSMVLYGPGGEESVEMLSGGERIAAALALRLGIAKALSGPAMELIMLDEPTVHLDAHRRQDLVEIIKRLASIPQTIVVTHDKEFEQAADTLIIVEKSGGVSRVRVEGS